MAGFDNSHITRLTDLINDAVKDVIMEYAAIGQAVPSLDTLEPGPFPAPEAVPVQLRKAIQIIEAACAQLSCTVALPGSVLLNHEEPACLQVATEAQIADLLLDKPEGLSTSELSARSGLEEAKLTRVMRLLATRHCFKEVKPGVFANNRLSIQLLSTDAMSSIIGYFTDEGLRASSYLNDTLTTPSGTDDDIPFKRSSGHRLYDYYRTDRGHKQGKRFTRAMIGWGDVTGKGFLPQAYPWAAQPAETTLCDVGGGNGWVSIGLMRAHPHIKVILQDQPQVVETAKQLWAREHPSAIEQGKVEFVPFDFLKDAAVEGCDFYYLRSILHNWPDSECELILKNVRKSMKPSSKLILGRPYLHNSLKLVLKTFILLSFGLDEYVLLEAVQAQGYSVDAANTSLSFAPEPLLGNYGAGRIRAYNMNLLMMNIFGAQERTFSELVSLCDKCGFIFSKLYEAGEMDLLEFSPI
ncbi:hypothetical protein GYMLUDRAFT_58461 [Collybiopsis luxurians FD-317 M1]|uniref:O-methyltransferase domain-containing protein n=1 Tax=Collybiopsis luxurians FD-317 M1 TaxID=944289 RepID=A0A0D0CSI1_9AGAR|nr:hypothetical protein GYMLUDRAFT_58461 [Collybiopsis luxurians FD-317 M1]